jgi:hypothetical protein
MRYLLLIRTVLALAGVIFLGWRAMRDLRIALSERAPTAIAAANFGAEYRGQQWIEVDGVMAIEQAYIQPLEKKSADGKELAYIYVAIVGPDWKPSEPVHVIARFGPNRLATAKGALAKQAGKPVQVGGKVNPPGDHDLKSMFPKLTFGDPVIFIIQGSDPAPLYPSLILFGAALVCLIITVRGIRQLIREKFMSPPPSSPPTPQPSEAPPAGTGPPPVPGKE